jgi:hypothetical protein
MVGYHLCPWELGRGREKAVTGIDTADEAIAIAECNALLDGPLPDIDTQLPRHQSLA